MAELFDGFNSRVRTLIGASESQLSDTTIESFEISGIAKKYIDSLVVETDLTDEEQAIKESCYVYQTALYSLPTINNNSIKVRQTTNAKIEYSSSSNDELIEKIKDRLCQCLIMLGANSFTGITQFAITNDDAGYEGELLSHMSDFKNTVTEFGEDLLFETQIIKSSLTSSTKAVYSLTNKDCFIEGQTVKGSPSIANGDYFQRLSDDSTYFIIILSPETFADDLFYMYATKCNAIISIQRNVEVRDEYSGDLISEGWQDVYTDVKCYRDVVTRTNKMTNDGAKDQTIYTLIIPHKYLISENDRVVMMSNQEGTEKLTNYKVESTGSQINGIDLVQMSLDLR